MRSFGMSCLIRPRKSRVEMHVTVKSKKLEISCSMAAINCGGIVSSNYALTYNVGWPHVHKTNFILRKNTYKDSALHLCPGLSAFILSDPNFL